MGPGDAIPGQAAGVSLDSYTQPLTLLPSQATPLRQQDRGLVNICLQVLSDVAGVFQRGRRSGSGIYKDAELKYDETVEWAFDEHAPDRPFSLEWTADALGSLTGSPVHPDHLREAFRLIIAGHGQRRYRPR